MTDEEKQALLPLTSSVFRTSSRDSSSFSSHHRRRFLGSSFSSTLYKLVVLSILLRIGLTCTLYFLPSEEEHDSVGKERLCQLIAPLRPPRGADRDEDLDANKAFIFSAEYRNESSELFGGLVQVKSESFDDLVGPIESDPRWDVFNEIQAYLERSFPLVHERLTLTNVNTHGLVYEIEGSDKESLKPLLLMAHQDTVPVNPATLHLWTHPPWSGHYDGKYMWGRGAYDCKNTLSGILEALTFLLRADFAPRRTIVLGFGFDEETKGIEGGGHIAKWLEDKYGTDGLAMIVDEGGLGVGEMYGLGMAIPATTEKGRVNVNFTVHTTGGHSSIPPDHTGIGILSSLITSLESHAYSPMLGLSSPILPLLQCVTEHSPSRNISTSFRSLVREASEPKGEHARREVAKEFATWGRAQKYQVQTSQAVDLVSGGVKVNALPETSWATVNYRVEVGSKLETVYERIKEVVGPIAKEFDLETDVLGEKSMAAGRRGGMLSVVAIDELEPAPIAPTDSASWRTFAGTIQHVFHEYFDELVVAPGVMNGNTDTHWFWNLTRSIYRFAPMDRSASFGQHTVDEHLLFDDHIKGIWFFHELIRNIDAADLG